MKTIYQFLAICIGIVTYAQPAGSCTTGTTKLNAEGKLYGCVESSWRKLSEDVVANFNQGGINGRTARNGDYIYVQENGQTYQLPNIGKAPISIAGRQHTIGKMIYANGHFYQGVANGLWHQVDNEYGTEYLKCNFKNEDLVIETNLGKLKCLSYIGVQAGTSYTELYYGWFKPQPDGAFIVDETQGNCYNNPMPYGCPWCDASINGRYYDEIWETWLTTTPERGCAPVTWWQPL